MEIIDSDGHIYLERNLEIFLIHTKNICNHHRAMLIQPTGFMGVAKLEKKSSTKILRWLSLIFA